jgi:hypothetical protein
MNKKTRSIVVLFALAAGSLVTLATSPASPVKAAAPVESSAIYKITAVESDYTPIGCYGCPTSKTNVPTFTVQNSIGTTIAGASKIDTFSTSAWDQATNTQKTFEGGCAIVDSGLKCWGDNSRGQLGDETSTNSLTTPVTAKENGEAITKVTDLSTNGLTTCIVADGTLKCVGSGNWEGNYSKRYWIYDTTATVTHAGGAESNRVQVNTNLLNVYNAAGTVVYTKEDSNWIPDTLVSKNWTTFSGFGANVAKVQVGSANGSSSTPTICVLLTTGLAKCAVVTAGTATSITDSNTTEVRESDCDGSTTTATPPVKYEVSGEWCSTEQIGTRTTFERHSRGGNGTLTSSATWTWADAGVTGAVDMAMPSDSWGASSICFAGATTICRTFQTGEFGTAVVVENGENSQAVYITSGFGPPGLCLYSNETISCGQGTYATSGAAAKMASKVTPVAVMAKPLNIFYSQNQTMQKLYFLVPSGLLAAESWIFNCNGCPESQKVVTPVTAFSASTASAYNFVSSVSGSTDSADYIPMKVLSGTRSSSLKFRQVSIKISETGENLAGVSIKWTAPDAVGTLTLGSSASSDDKTDTSGLASVYLPNGPVTFTLSPPAITTNVCPPSCGTPSTVCPPTCVGSQNPNFTTTTTTTIPAPTGTLASGASLQAASITVVVPDSGTVPVIVPKPPTIFTRKISVTLENGTPVPSATVQLKNNYLTYAYKNSGSSTSTWSSRPKDTKGFLGQMNCAYCFVAPPKYVTGTDGTVSFQSFDQGTRSGAYDADVAYDDGVFNQIVKPIFTSLTETIKLPFMASVKVTLPDADPSTPAVEADADTSTPEVDLKTDSNGGVEVTTEVKDEEGTPMGGIRQVAEIVTTGCETGGLISSSTKVDTVCSDGAVVTDTVTKSSIDTISKASIVRAMKVKTAAGCAAIVQATAGSNGQAKLVLCPTASTKYRVRGKGALAAKTFCVRVNNTPCGAVSTSSTPTNTPTNTTPTYTYTDTYTPTVVVSKVAVMKKGKVTSFTTINKTAKVKIPKGAKVVLVVAVTTKKFCSISGTSVKALRPGSCTISVKVTPKATAKVKKPKTTTTKIKITIKK